MAYVISEDCIACGTCISECPSEAISEGDIYSINPDLCTECGTCADVCPNEAVRLGTYFPQIARQRRLLIEWPPFFHAIPAITL